MTVRGKGKLGGLSGQPYYLKGNTYPLPPPNALRPYVDTQAGDVDTWPAHASGLALSSTAARLSRNKSLVVVSEEESNKAPIVPKPRFLEQLETFLKKELRALGVSEVTPSDLRLQAHREVFEYLIEDFKTYKPMLSAIKNEYEMMLAFQRQQVRQLEPLKQMLVTVSEQCDQKIMALREEEKQEIVLRLQEKLREEYQKYRDECDARKLLIADINDLRYQQEDYMASKQTAAEQQETFEDPVMMKIALKKAREDEKAASVRLNEMIANYGDVIPRRDFEALEKKHKEIEDQFETVNTDFKKLQAEHNALLDVQKQVTHQRDQFYLELETLKRASTPRPDWEKCGEYIQGGMERWKELSEGKGSNELVDVLLSEMGSGGAADSVGADYFDGQGTGPSVPKYLQHEGPRTDGTRENMAEFLHTYLTRRFALEQMVVEWGYNLHDACQRYSHDPNIGLFWKVLSEEGDEEVFHEQLQMIHKLLTELTKQDADQGNQGKLDRATFQQVLTTTLPDLDEESLAVIVRGAETELDQPDMQEVEYKDLFTEDDEGKTGPFLDEVKKWAKQQKEAYITEIKEQLGDTSPVSVDDLKRALTMADPEIDTDHMEAYVRWAFKATTPEALADAEPIEQSKLLERLLWGNISRVGKKM
ncbi:hypothetical protein BaRGS_00025695 [Batillaria attramentaria]|uniref:Translin-associated factor X-interacting protein 1 N-terminal domain-containing protein n=1 Tax=Batillaria attramentaria TaxID=370345 RepID=A0ABD0K7Q7_9CAEN